MTRSKRSELSPAHIERLIHAAQIGPLLWRRSAGGGVGWKLSGSERALVYRLISEVGLQPDEIPTLMPGDFCLCDNLPHVVPGIFAVPERRALRLPLDRALAAFLREFLIDKDDAAPLFMLASVDNLKRAVQFDARAAGLTERRFLVVRLAAAFTRNAHFRSEDTAAAVEVLP